MLYTMPDKKIILKEINKKTVTKYKASGALRTIWDEEFWRGASENFSKTGRLFALSTRRAELNQNEEISALDGDRQ